ncbi:baseplate J/gp47 family protein [Hymenobacter pini]|uniref:baseplate J/gp47 family protein n=1 Tax=Hymenobacter pini TaxID=2880879 RepID=UPI001CF298D1|nr:baseplate J/gp47 family protein [Hymenobacter pini]MCA8829714.1 baseplate J/gp47 family protein [Hymenobacter pini]
MGPSSTPSFQDSGTSQPGRRQPLLLDSRVVLADYTTEDLLAYVSYFSKLVRYYEVVDGQVETRRTWRLGEKRSLLIIAQIATQRLPAQYDYFARLIREVQDPMATSAQQQQARRTLLGRIYKMATQFDHWCESHLRSHTRRTFQAELHAAVDELVAPLQRAATLERALLEHYGLPARTASDRGPEQLLHIWSATPRPQPPVPATLAAVDEELTDLLWTFYKAQTSLAALAQRVLRSSLRETPPENDMLPEMALLLTFLELYKHAQQALNDIPRRHLDYYYRQVLHVVSRPARPDHAFLVFTLAKGVPEARLPAGITVEGGKDAQGQQVVFTTTEPVRLAPWRLEQLSSIFVSGLSAGAVRGVYVAPQANSADGQGRPLPDPATGWAPFGSSQELLAPPARTMTSAAVGFAVSAAVLLLREGRRTVELSLRCEPASFAHFAAALAPAGTPLQRAFDKLGLEPFRVDVTGTEGWLPLRVQELRLLPDTHTVCWQLTIDREQPALVAHQPALHPGQFRSEWPVLRLQLHEQAPDYAYSSFSALQPLTITLRVQAQDVQTLQLANQLGPLAPGLPFAPFGPQAQPGDYLLVGFPELFRKRLTQLILTLDWAQLPLEPNGFADYYQGYQPPLHNDSFQVAASYRRDWRWVPQTTPETQLALFQTMPDLSRPAGTVLLPSTHLVLATHAADFRRQPAVADGPLQAEAATGAIRLELVAPASGFGTEQYPPLLVETLQYNARNPSRPRPLPHPPFVPMVKSTWLSYAAEEEIDVPALFGPAAAGQAQFYYVHPLGEYQPTRCQPAAAVSPEQSQLPRPAYHLSLLPEFTDEGTLYFGLTGFTPPLDINLLFELAPFTSLPRQQEVTLAGYRNLQPTVEWAYLVGDEWRPFSSGTSSRDDVVHDQSAGLTEQQPVHLHLPAALDTHHTIMPDGLYWLRATVRRGAEFVPHVRQIHTQVVPAVRLATSPEQHLTFEAHLPAHSLTRLLKPLPAVAKVTQPLPSFGGRSAETHDEYNTRVSERLRHRGRAVTPWDYEHLVLEHFPEVFRVKCLRANQVPQTHRRPGLVLLMVVPHQPVTAGYRLPVFSPDHLAHIRNFVRKVASAQVQLEVCNPLYEMIQVRAGVQFTKAARLQNPPPGALIQQVQQALNEFLSPWNTRNPARQGLHFSLTSSMILSFLNQLPYVEAITGFSVIKLALEDDQYLFYDTQGPTPAGAAAAAAAQPQPLEDATHRPWSVYVSAEQHQLTETKAGTAAAPQARPTGIGRLAIGTDFILPRSFEAPANN